MIAYFCATLKTLFCFSSNVEHFLIVLQEYMIQRAITDADQLAFNECVLHYWVVFIPASN